MSNAAISYDIMESAWHTASRPHQPVAIGGLSRAEISAELAKGMDSLHSGGMTPDEVDAALGRDFDR